MNDAFDKEMSVSMSEGSSFLEKRGSGKGKGRALNANWARIIVKITN